MLAKAKYLPRYALLYGPLLLAATGPWNPLLNVVNMPEGLDVSSPSTSWLVPTPNKTGGFFSVKGAMNHKYVPYMLIQGEQCTTYATYPLAVAPKPAAAVIEVAWRDENVDKMLKTDDVAEVNDALETGDDSAIPSLRELAAAQDLFIGTCVDSGQPLGNASYLDGNYTRFSAEQFSIVTAEGSMKWAYTQPADDGKFVFTGGDQIIAAAHTHKWKVRGHNLAWDIANPKWLYQNFTGKKLRQLLKTHIDTVVGRWKGEIYSCESHSFPFSAFRCASTVLCIVISAFPCCDRRGRDQRRDFVASSTPPETRHCGLQGRSAVPNDRVVASLCRQRVLHRDGFPLGTRSRP